MKYLQELIRSSYFNMNSTALAWAEEPGNNKACSLKANPRKARSPAMHYVIKGRCCARADEVAFVECTSREEVESSPESPIELRSR